MSRVTRSPCTTVALLLLCGMPSATACTSWQTQSGDVATVIAPRPAKRSDRASGAVPGLAPSTPAQSGALTTAETVDRMRVITTKGAVVELHHPRVTNDTLYGQPSKDGPETAFPLAEISKVQVKKVSAAKTAGLAVGAAATVFVGLTVWAALYFANY